MTEIFSKRVVSVFLALVIVFIFYKTLLNKKMIIINKSQSEKLKVNNRCFKINNKLKLEDLVKLKD